MAIDPTQFNSFGGFKYGQSYRNGSNVNEGRGNSKAFHLPIELKLDHSSDLWSAIQDQLIPLYTSSPDTGGRGMLLVIWFNDQSKGVALPANSTKPNTAAELKVMLESTLSFEESKLIDVFVFDVASKNRN